MKRILENTALQYNSNYFNFVKNQNLYTVAVLIVTAFVNYDFHNSCFNSRKKVKYNQFFKLKFFSSQIISFSIDFIC